MDVVYISIIAYVNSYCNDVVFMLITNPDTVKQALANIRLEGLFVSQDIKDLLEKALSDPSITTEYILKVLRAK